MEEKEIEGDAVYEVALHDRAYQKTKQEQKEIPIVLVVAGSEGVDNTVKSLLLASYELGYRAIAVDPKDANDADRLGKVVQALKDQHPDSEMLGIGVEYGANLLVNLAAKRADVFAGLISIGNPFDLVKSEINLQNSWVWHFLYRSVLKGRINKASKLISSSPAAFQSSDLFELDRQLHSIPEDQYLSWKQ
jgi:predicted alpha/beta-fold hydrolase